MKSNIEIEVSFMVGTEIHDAINEAKQKAIAWGVAYVCFNFNGVSMSIGKNANVKKCISDFKSRDCDCGIVSA